LRSAVPLVYHGVWLAHPFAGGKFVAPENYSHMQQYGLGLRLRIGLNSSSLRVKFKVRVRIRSRVKIRIRARVEIRVRVSVSYIMTIWRWEEFSMCDKFPTTPVRSLACSFLV